MKTMTFAQRYFVTKREISTRYFGSNKEIAETLNSLADELGNEVIFDYLENDPGMAGAGSNLETGERMFCWFRRELDGLKKHITIKYTPGQGFEALRQAGTKIRTDQRLNQWMLDMEAYRVGKNWQESY